MPIEINQLTVTARVREELRDTACGDQPNTANRNQNSRGQAPVTQRGAVRQATESAAELIKRQKER